MAKFPRSQTLVQAKGLNTSLGRVSQSDISTGISGEDLQGIGAAIHNKGQQILQRDGETLAIEHFAEFQRSELLRFNDEKLAASNDPEGFTERFMEQNKKNFDALSGQVSNKFYTKTMTGRFSGLSNSLVFSATSFEANQKVANRKARYASAVGSYSSTVYEDPTQLGNIVNLAKGDAEAAAASGIFGSEGIELADSSAKKIVTSAISGVIERSPQDLDNYIKSNGLDKLLTTKELASFRSGAKKNIKNAKRVEKANAQMQSLSRKKDVMDLYIDGELSLGSVDNMTELSDTEKDVARKLAIGDVSLSDNPKKLGELLSKRADLLSDEKKDTPLIEGLSDLMGFQNDVYEALGIGINNAEARMLTKGITDSSEAAMERRSDTIGAKVNNLSGSMSGNRKALPEERAILAINTFTKDKTAGQKRKLIRAVSSRLQSVDLENLDDSAVDNDGGTELENQIDAIVQSEISKMVKGLQRKSGSVNRVIGSDGSDGFASSVKSTAKSDTSIIANDPERSFGTVEEAEASGVRGIVLIGGRRARID